MECNVLVTSFSFVSGAKVVVPFRFVSAMFQTWSNKIGKWWNPGWRAYFSNGMGKNQQLLNKIIAGSKPKKQVFEVNSFSRFRTTIVHLLYFSDWVRFFFSNMLLQRWTHDSPVGRTYVGIYYMHTYFTYIQEFESICFFCGQSSKNGFEGALRPKQDIPSGFHR